MRYCVNCYAILGKQSLKLGIGNPNTVRADHIYYVWWDKKVCWSLIRNQLFQCLYNWSIIKSLIEYINMEAAHLLYIKNLEPYQNLMYIKSSRVSLNII